MSLFIDLIVPIVVKPPALHGNVLIFRPVAYSGPFQLPYPLRTVKPSPQCGSPVGDVTT